MGDWIFQANPRHYDIVAALSQLEEIAWRVPQHTGDVQTGDGVFLWRSGKEAGIVGIGTVAALPSLLPVPETERPYVLEAGTEGGEETRVVVRVRQVKPVPKTSIASLPEMAEHRICTAPMGTVFPLDEDQKEMKAYLDGYFKDNAHLFHIAENTDVLGAIEKFQLKSKINLLIMIHNKHNFFENLLFKPVINQVAYHTNIPFLVIPSEDRLMH